MSFPWYLNADVTQNINLENVVENAYFDQRKSVCRTQWNGTKPSVNKQGQGMILTQFHGFYNRDFVNEYHE